MYFSGNISIDPSHLTHIDIIKPTKIFGRILHVLTAGRSSEKEEQETFTAVFILQQINASLRSQNITNIVRLAKDDINFYLDEEGKQDDMKEAMDHFKLEVDHYESELFNKLYLVAEYQDELINYLIEVDIQRRHKVGEFPIQVKVNGVIRELALGKGETTEDLQNRMKQKIGNQQQYDEFLMKHQTRFDQFLASMDQNLRKHIQVDSLSRSSKKKIIRPRTPVKDSEQTQSKYQYDREEPVFHGYYGFGDFFFYAWMWSGFTHDHHLQVNQFDMVDEHGTDMMSVGDTGFNAGSSDAMDPSAEFQAPVAEDVLFHEGHEYDDAFQSADLLPDSATDAGGAEVSEGGGWFDSFTDIGGGGDASCSSCSSCGGGCGGD
jgi:hypothetical protein